MNTIYISVFGCFTPIRTFNKTIKREHLPGLTIPWVLKYIIENIQGKVWILQLGFTNMELNSVNEVLYSNWDYEYTVVTEEKKPQHCGVKKTKVVNHITKQKDAIYQNTCDLNITCSHPLACLIDTPCNECRSFAKNNGAFCWPFAASIVQFEKSPGGEGYMRWRHKRNNWKVRLYSTRYDVTSLAVTVHKYLRLIMKYVFDQ